MKKTIIGLSLIATLVCSASDQYTQMSDLALSDVKALNSYAMGSLDEISSSETELKNYQKRVDAYSLEISNMLKTAEDGFTSKDDALRAMDSVEALSTQILVLSKTMLYLSSHQADNASDAYIATLNTTSKTILRLSDDIGVMADRILDMADKIGVMADRIVKTQEIQSSNYKATLKFINTSMNTVSNQNGMVTKNNTAPQMNSPMSGNTRTMGSSPSSSMMGR